MNTSTERLTNSVQNKTGPASIRQSSGDVVLREDGPQGPDPIQGWRFYAVTGSLLFCLILSVIDSTIIATALVTIGAQFSNFVDLQWVVLAYLLTNLSFCLIFTRISDVLGRKWTLIASLSIVLFASLGAGLSKSLQQVIVFRAFQGLGGAGLYSLPFTIIPEITPPKKFHLVNAALGMSWTISAVLGPTIGGVITTRSTWRWVFFFNVPCCGFLILLILLCWPRTKSPGALHWRQLDFVGCVLFVAASLPLILALQEAGSGQHAWGSATIVLCLIISGLATIALAVWMKYLSTCTHRVMPLFSVKIVTHRVMLGVLIVTTLTGYIFFTIVVGLPERIQIVNLKSPETAGISLLPFSGALAFGSAVGGMISSRAKGATYGLATGSVLMLLGSGLLSSIGYGNGAILDSLYGYLVFVGLGCGMVLSSGTVMIKLYPKPEDAASAQGLLSQARFLGGNIGLAVATIITNQRLVSDLQDILSPAQLANLQRSLTVIATLKPQQILAVGRTFARAFQTELQVCAGIAGLSLIFSCLTYDRHAPLFAEVVARGAATTTDEKVEMEMEESFEGREERSRQDDESGPPGPY